MRIYKIINILMISLLIYTGVAYSGEKSNALVILNHDVTYNDAKKILKELNIHPKIFFEPSSIYLSGDKENIQKLNDYGIIRDTFFSKYIGDVRNYSNEEKSAISFFNKQRDLDSAINNNKYESRSDQRSLTQPVDMMRHDKRGYKKYYNINYTDGETLEKPADFYFTSEYLLGDVVVAVIIPESNGAYMESTENWDGVRLWRVLDEISLALGWWSTRDLDNLVTFHVKYYLLVPTKYEIINMTAGGGEFSDQALWMDDILSNMGYTEELYPAAEYDYMDKAFAFLNDARSASFADWAISFIVIDSLNDDDGMFSNFYFAYSYLGGPFTIMTYDNEGYGIDNMREIALHEMAHQFYALDEYYSSYEPCTSISGYLGIDNQNSEYSESGNPCDSNAVCVMRDLGRSTFPYDSGLICEYTTGQIGWYDYDENDIFDPLDTYPLITIDPFLDGALEFSGKAIDIAYPNYNPLRYPKGVERIDITINKIEYLQYRLNSEPWIDIIPIDGEAGDKMELFSFKPVASITGNYSLELRAVNSIGNETRQVIDNDIYLESTAGGSTVSLFDCFIAEASYKSNDKSNCVLKLFNTVKRWFN